MLPRPNVARLRQNSSHFLFHCPLLSEQRWPATLTLMASPAMLHYRLSQLLSHGNDTIHSDRSNFGEKGLVWPHSSLEPTVMFFTQHTILLSTVTCGIGKCIPSHWLLFLRTDTFGHPCSYSLLLGTTACHGTDSPSLHVFLPSPDLLSEELPVLTRCPVFSGNPFMSVFFFLWGKHSQDIAFEACLVTPVPVCNLSPVRQSIDVCSHNRTPFHPLVLQTSVLGLRKEHSCIWWQGCVYVVDKKNTTGPQILIVQFFSHK